MTLGYSSSGVPLWTNVYEGAWPTLGKVVATDPNGNVVAAGTTWAYNRTNEFMIVKYSSAIPPRLAIARTNSSALAVSWPSPSHGFVLQESTDARGLTWDNVSMKMQDDGLQNRMVVEPGTSGRFYRLFKP